MRAKMRCARPEEVEFTIEITASGAQWEVIRQALHSSTMQPVPVMRLHNAITGVIAQSRAVFVDEEPPEG